MIDDDEYDRKYNAFMKKHEALLKECRCGVSYPDGWYDILDKLLTDIGEVVKKDAIEEFSIVQIKEKFGGLRVYCHASNEEIENLIREAEREVSQVCCICGTIENLEEGGWGYIKCKVHT